MRRIPGSPNSDPRPPLATEVFAPIPEQGSFLGVLTGCTTSPPVLVEWVKNGQAVTLSWANGQGTSNTTACTITGMPEAIRPGSVRPIDIRTINSGVVAAAIGFVELDGTITLYSTPGEAAFTNSGTKGLKAGSASYLL